MKMQSRFGLATAFLLVLPIFAEAQHVTGSYRVAPSVPVSVGTRGSSAAAGAHAANRASGRHVARSAGSTTSGVVAADSSAAAGTNGFGFFGLGSDGLSVQQILNPFPSYGFDFEHLMALNRDANIKLLLDPATQAKLALANRRFHNPHKTNNNTFFFLDGGGAYVLPVDPNAGVNADSDAGVAQQQGPEQEQSGQDAVQQEQSNEVQVAPQEETLPDEGEFTLILRSGQEIEAVAFTRVGDRIVYITVNGGRRTLALGDLDADATVRLNQERGTPLQIPL